MFEGILERSDAISTGDEWFVPKPIIEQTMQTHVWVLALFCLFALIGLVYSLRLVRANKSLYPLYVYFGIGFACIYEPLGDLLIHVTYAEVGQINIWRAFGYNVALWVFPCYLFIGGWPANWMLNRLRQGVTFRWWMRSFFIFVLAMYAFEIPGLHLAGRQWEYYGPQPLVLFDYPMPMAFTNASAFIFVTAALAKLLLSHEFIQRRPMLLVPLMAMIFPCASASAIYPWGYAINATDNQFLINLGGILSMLVSVFQVWICGKFVCVPTTERQTATDRVDATAPVPQRS